MNKAQQVENKTKSRMRARVEHVVGAMENEMGGIFLRTIGMARAVVGVGLMALAHNLKRTKLLIRKKVLQIGRVSVPGMRKMA